MTTIPPISTFLTTKKTQILKPQVNQVRSAIEELKRSPVLNDRDIFQSLEKVAEHFHIKKN